MSFLFRVGADCLSKVLSCGILFESRILVGLPVVVINNISLNVCATFLSASLIISPWSVYRSELDWGKLYQPMLEYFDWLAVVDKYFLFSKFCTVLCTHIGPKGSWLMEGLCNSSLTYLPLSSFMFNEEGSGSFAANQFNSLTTWVEFSGLSYWFFCYFI